jgi:hypothetical protein
MLTGGLSTLIPQPSNAIASTLIPQSSNPLSQSATPNPRPQTQADKLESEAEGALLLSEMAIEQHLRDFPDVKED